MSIELALRIMTHWQLLLVAGFMVVFLPLVNYIASVERRPRRKRFIPPAEKALRQTAE